MDADCSSSTEARLTSRLFQDESDLRQMLSLLMAARAQTSDWRYAHVGELLWDYFLITCHLSPQQHIRLWHDGQALVAYALLGEDPTFSCAVLPEAAWSGIEAEALAWAQGRVAALRAKDPARWGGELVSHVRQDDAQRLAFLEQHGFCYRGTFAEVNLLRSLAEPIAVGPLPPGYEVRAVAESEIVDRAGAERDVWLPWPVGDINGDDYARLMQFPGYERELDVVAVAPNGVIAAYVNCWTDPVNGIGDFGPVGARSAYRRQGLTRAVLLEGLRRFKARGMDRACVSTNATNTPARGLYESVGFRIVNRTLDYACPP
jgi:ribosomal protein S18 acetylase RimI-like enzyme